MAGDSPSASSRAGSPASSPGSPGAAGGATGPRWFDSHCHLQDEPDPAAVVARAAEAGVGAMVCVGTDVGSSGKAIELTSALGAGGEGTVSMWATVGLHPHYADREGDEGVEGVAALLDRTRLEPPGCGSVVAVGECGLDYHYDRSPRPVQRRAFAAQVGLAAERGLTLVVHTREAWADTFAVLGSQGPPARTVFHCFTGGPAEAERALELGAWLSFSGIATFKGADEVRAAAALCPADRLLVETDAPFLAPAPHRGRPNQPAFVGLVGAAVAETRGVVPDELAASSWAAARSAFGLEAAPA